jgi:hypothetical protein
MPNYTYLIIGGGMTAGAAIGGIREVDGGVLLWNVWEQVEAARKLIAEAAPFRGENLTGRLPA